MINHSVDYLPTSRPWPDDSDTIPRMLWQTSRSRELTEEALGCRDLWLERCPGWAYRLMDDAEAREFVHDCYNSEIGQTYDSFPLGVMRADFWRILVIYYEGGLYSDIDTAPMSSPSQWIDLNDRFVCAAEKDGIHLCNWTFAGSKGHPVLATIIDFIVRRAKDGIETDNEHFVHYHTGPGVFRDGIRYWLGMPNATIAELVAASAQHRISSGIRILDEHSFDGRYVEHYFASLYWPEDHPSWKSERLDILSSEI